MAWLVGVVLGNTAFATSAAVLLVLDRLDGSALIGAAITGMLVALASFAMVSRVE
jgi:hypothetical protein